MPTPDSFFVLHVSTPLGLLKLTANKTHLLSATFPEKEPETDSPVLPACLQQAAAQLQEYFAGQRFTFDLPLAAQGTVFQQQVWQTLTQIEAGKTDSYLGLAKRLGNAAAVRAVGLANGANPWLIVVPCHRIIGANKKLVGYAGGLWRKQWLLQHEAKMIGVYQTSLFDG